MTPSMWIGMLGGVFIGWLIGAMFSDGPKTPLEALSGDHDSSGPGCFTFLALVLICGGIGLMAGAFVSAG